MRDIPITLQLGKEDEVALSLKIHWLSLVLPKIVQDMNTISGVSQAESILHLDVSGYSWMTVSSEGRWRTCWTCDHT